MSLALRAVSSVYVNNANSAVISLPAGAVAGDTLIIFASHAYNVVAPTGFTVLHNVSQSNYQGGTFTKVLVAADITAGSFTISFGGVYYGDIAAVCIVGSTMNIRYKAFASATSGASSRSQTTNATPLTGDLAIYYAAGRGNTTISSSQGAAQASNASVNSSFVLTAGNLAADGAITETWTYPVVPTGDYQALLIVTDATIPTYAEVADMQVEVLRSGTPNAQVADMQVEVLRSGVPVAQISDMYVEVLRAVTSVVRRRPVFLLISAMSDGGIHYPANALFIDGAPVLIDSDSLDF